MKYGAFYLCSVLLSTSILISGCSGGADNNGQDGGTKVDQDAGSMADTGSTSSDSGTHGPDSSSNNSDGGEPDGGEIDPCAGVGPDLVCVPDDPTNVYSTDLCGNPSGVNTACAGTQTCEVHSDGQAYCACPLTGVTTCNYPNGTSSLYEPSQVVRERSCENTREEPADFVEDCEWGTMCFSDPDFNGGEALCHRSIDESQSASPYYDFGCSQFSMWMRHPTSLEADCRCRLTGDGQGGAGGMGNALADPNNTDITMGARPGGPIANCLSQNSMETRTWPVAYGSGPSFNAWKQQNSSGASWFSGAVDPVSREMYSIVKWTYGQNSRSATVVAWNLDTKDRRVVSGIHPDPRLGPVEYGSGYLSPQPNNRTPLQPLTGANVLRIGPDNMLYTYGGGTGESTGTEREIVRIDPTSGERTLVWKAQDSATGDLTNLYGQCFRPDAFGNLQSVGLNAQAFEVGPDGTFYMAMRGTREGDGIVAVTADGLTCSYISRWGGMGHNPGGGAVAVPPPAQIGGGFALQFPVHGLLFHDNKIFGVSEDDLYSFDVASGQRILESYTTGTYGGMGYANMFWDPTRSVIWAVGTVAPYVGSIVDLTTGRRESIYGDTGFTEYADEAILRSVYPDSQSVDMGTMLSNSNVINFGGVVLDPANNDIVYAVLKSGGLMKMELSTFNNYVHSW